MRQLMVAAFLLTAIYACDPPKQNTESGVEKVSYGSVYDSLTALIEQEVSNPDLYQQRAAWLKEQERFDEALADINRCIKLDSLNGQYYVDKAEVFIEMKEIGKAKAFLDEGIKSTPGSTEIMLKISEIYLWSGDYQQTIDWANAALQFDEYIAEAYYLKGMAHQYSNDTTKAVSSLKTAVEQDPNHYNAYMQLGKLYAIAQHELADAYYSNALNVKPGSMETLYARGLFRQNSNQPEKAIEDYEEMLLTEPKHVAANYNIGYVKLILLEQPDSAISYFEKASINSPDYVDATYMWGYCLELLFKYDEALAKYREVLSIQDTHTLAAKGVNRLESNR